MPSARDEDPPGALDSPAPVRVAEDPPAVVPPPPPAPAPGGRTREISNAAGLVYGTILVATLLAAESAVRLTFIRTEAAVIATLAAYWITLAYARFQGERLEQSAPFRWRRLMSAAAHELTVLGGAAIPMTAVLISWAIGISLETAVTIAVYCAAATIVSIELTIGYRTGQRGVGLVFQSAVGILLGLLVIAIRVLLH